MGDATKHNVEVKPIDINHSYWDNILEEKVNNYCALRLGFRQIKGIRQEDITILVDARTKLFTSINELLGAGVSIAALERLADADAFRSVGFDRRQALWEITALHDNPVAIFKGQQSESKSENNVKLPQLSLSEHVLHGYAVTSLSVKAHPVSFIREQLSMCNVIPTGDLIKGNDSDIVRVAGLILVRQRPGTAGGICFITIEDETGNANLVVFKNLFENIYRKEILQSKLLMVEGKLQKEGEVIHVIVQHCENWSKLLRKLTSKNKDEVSLSILSPRDENDGTRFSDKHNTYGGWIKQEKLFPEARNFK